MDIYAGLDLGGSSLKYGYGNLSSGLLSFSRQSHHNQGREEIYQLFSTAVHHIKGSLSASNTLAGLTIGSPGYVDPTSGEILANSPNLKGWVGANPKKFLEDHFSIPVSVDNDANLMAFGEANTNQRSATSLLGITIGTGIGSGFVTHNRIYHGSFLAGMELGHIIIKEQGLPCQCGKSGCLEAYTSIPALEKEVASLINKSLDIERILALSREDQNLQKIIQKAYNRLGLAIANALTLLDPQIVVIGGGLTECPSFSIDPLLGEIHKYLNGYQRNRVAIQTAVLKNRAAVWGAIVLAEKSR